MRDVPPLVASGDRLLACPVDPLVEAMSALELRDVVVDYERAAAAACARSRARA